MKKENQWLTNPKQKAYLYDHLQLKQNLHNRTMTNYFVFVDSQCRPKTMTF